MHNYQQLNLKNRLSKQAEQKQSQIWRSFGGLSVGKGKGENEGKDAGIKKYKLVGTE